MRMVLMIWFVAWAVSSNDHPWWWHAMVITLGYAVGRIMCDWKELKKKEEKKTDV